MIARITTIPFENDTGKGGVLLLKLYMVNYIERHAMYKIYDNGLILSPIEWNGLNYFRHSNIIIFPMKFNQLEIQKYLICLFTLCLSDFLIVATTLYTNQNVGSET